MSRMYTLCPHCSTCFRITTEQVNAAQGNVRCGNCGAVFNALDNPAPDPDMVTDPLFAEEEPFSTELYRQDVDELPPFENSRHAPLPPEPSELFPEAGFIPLGEDGNETERLHFESQDEEPEQEAPAPARSESIILPPAAESGAEELHEYFVQDVEDATIEDLEKLFLPEQEEDTSPSPAEEPEPSSATPIASRPPAKRGAIPARFSTSRPLLSVASLLLIALLLGQYIYFARDHLAQRYPGLRPLLGKMCDNLGCRLPLRRAPEKLQLTHRDVRTHPTIEDALLINATFVNRAKFRQPYPLIELKLSNINGKLIGRRTFLPREYLAGQPDIDAGIPPDTQVHLVLELSDPGKQAVNFEFDFR